jgi:hypothetical protein
MTSKDEVGTRFVKLKERNDLLTKNSDDVDVNEDNSKDTPDTELRNRSNGDGISGFDVDSDYSDIHDIREPCKNSGEPSPS